MRSSFTALARRLGRKLVPSVATRSMEAAAGGRRWAGVMETPSALSALHAGRVITMRRARTLYLNNALFRSAVDAWVSGLAGSGIRTQPQHPDPAVRELLAAAFERWTDEADADGRTDWYGLLSLVVTLMVRDGEAFVVMETTDDGRLRLRVHDAEMVDGSFAQDLGNGLAGC